jgi:hypothetical protein
MAIIIALIFVVAAIIVTGMLIARNRWKIMSWWLRVEKPWQKKRFDKIQDDEDYQPLHA